MDQLRIILLTRSIFSKASHTPSEATTMRAPVAGTRTCAPVQAAPFETVTAALLSLESCGHAQTHTMLCMMCTVNDMSCPASTLLVCPFRTHLPMNA